MERAVVPLPVFASAHWSPVGDGEKVRSVAALEGGGLVKVNVEVKVAGIRKGRIAAGDEASMDLLLVSDRWGFN